MPRSPQTLERRPVPRLTERHRPRARRHLQNPIHPAATTATSIACAPHFMASEIPSASARPLDVAIADRAVERGALEEAECSPALSARSRLRR
jgi:hypothetical protein